MRRSEIVRGGRYEGGRKPRLQRLVTSLVNEFCYITSNLNSEVRHSQIAVAYQVFLDQQATETCGFCTLESFAKWAKERVS